jgi:glycosyltransferase involved in cell wall biosynthesis
VNAGEITVAVATCGRPDSLSRCLRALAAQTALPLEVIVVDQAPSDRARDAVAASGLSAVRYLEQPCLGLSASRNLALRSAAGARLAVTDDDCAPDPSWLAAVAAALDRTPRPEAVTGPILPLGDAPPGSFAVSLRESDVAVDHAGGVSPWHVGSGANFAAHVVTLRGSGGWDERLGAGSPGQAAEDADLLHRLLRSGSRIRYEPAAIVRHEWQPRSRRLATRWSYGYGIGSMCGLWLARRDPAAARVLLGYARLHVRPLLGGIRRRERARIAEHGRAIASVVPGLVHGLRVARLPPSSVGVTPP